MHTSTLFAALAIAAGASAQAVVTYNCNEALQACNQDVALESMTDHASSQARRRLQSAPTSSQPVRDVLLKSTAAVLHHHRRKIVALFRRRNAMSRQYHPARPWVTMAVLKLSLPAPVLPRPIAPSATLSGLHASLVRKKRRNAATNLEQIRVCAQAVLEAASLVP
ncbi:hypothetical protein PRZ48_014376 [Zasmidium cellare]|uniref:Uncharacterized protein n=1 Tax=Zasmidium cellare TaxID=395010 RepID=A0ABR0DYL4_ZASCE|nr:hypothetical protein PRZ48_014376 [Zasmidium cellare]